MIDRYLISIALNAEEKDRVVKLKERGFGNKDIFRKGLEVMYKQIFKGEK